MSYLAEFRRKVESELKKRKWSRARLAEKTGINKTLLNYILSGKRRFNEDQIIQIALAFKLEPYQLFTSSNLYSEGLAKMLIRDATDAMDKNYTVIPEVNLHNKGNMEHFTLDQIIGYRVVDRVITFGLSDPFFVKIDKFIAEPPFKHGDTFVVDRSMEIRKQCLPTAIYMIDLMPGKDTPMIRIQRAKYNKNKRELTLLYLDNEKVYSRISLKPEERITDYVVGIVTWMGRKLF